ncbi:MAG: dTMP kinase [Desulfovibrio sp.]|jgi:dTMP kinase|nr:dTMP kinase [Desulfovibrio sp.]
MFISFEGIEGSGKSTTLNSLCAALADEGISFVRTNEPGGSAIGRALRPLLLDRDQQLAQLAELFGFLADRAQHVSAVIRPALEIGDVVISDRYADSTIAYQGYGWGMDINMLNWLNQTVTGGLAPDLTILFDLEVEDGLRRVFSRNADRAGQTTEERFEAEPIDFHRRVREGYLKLAEMHPQRFRLVDASLPQEMVYGQITDILAERCSIYLS